MAATGNLSHETTQGAANLSGLTQRAACEVCVKFVAAVAVIAAAATATAAAAMVAATCAAQTAAAISAADNYVPWSCCGC